MRYDRPFAEISPDDFLVGFREVWTSTHGRATRYHVMIDGGVAACRSKQQTWRNRSVIVLNEDTLMPIGEVPAYMLCKRAGCRQLCEEYLNFGASERAEFRAKSSARLSDPRGSNRQGDRKDTTP